MKKLEIVFAEGLKEYYNEYGYLEFTRKVLNKCPDKKEYGLTGLITIEDVELSKRVFIKNEYEDEFTIRYFIQYQTNKQWSASYTLYKTIWNEDGSGHGEIIYDGYTNAKYIQE